MKANFLAFAGLASLALAGLPMAAQGQDDYPNRQVRIIVGSSAGGTADTLSRLIAENLTKSLGQTFYVENMPGAGGALASTTVAQSEPDGYTLQFAFISSHSILPNLNKDLEYDPIVDFAPVAVISYSPNVLLANPAFGVTTVEELVAKLQAAPGEYDFGSAGLGGSQHLATELFLQATGTEAVHIPYTGSGELLPALLANQVPFAFDTMTTAVPHIESGALIALGVSGAERSTVLPDAPTIAETVPGFEVTAWNGVLAPAGTSPDIIAKLNTAINDYLGSDEGTAFLARLGTIPGSGGPDVLGDLIKSDLAKFGKIIEDANITME